MKIDGGCHCGYITYEAEIDPDKTLDLPLHRLPNAIGLGFPSGRIHTERCLQVTFRRTENLRQDQRKREQTATIFLPGMWNADLCNDRRSRTEGLLPPSGHCSSTRSACPKTSRYGFAPRSNGLAIRIRCRKSKGNLRSIIWAT